MYGGETFEKCWQLWIWLPVDQAFVYRGANFIFWGAYASLCVRRKSATHMHPNKRCFHVGLLIFIYRKNCLNDSACPIYDYLLEKHVSMPSSRVKVLYLRMDLWVAYPLPPYKQRPVCRGQIMSEVRWDLLVCFYVGHQSASYWGDRFPFWNKSCVLK